MKHNPSKLLSLLFAVPLVCMCSKENSNEPAPKGEQITITATMSDTKVDLTQGQGKLLLTWSEGDALMVIGNTAEKYDIVDDGSGIGTRTATFLGPSVEGEKFIVYYPGTYATVEDLTARSYESQVQTGNGNLEHLEYNSLAQGLSDFRVVNFGADGVLNNGVLKLVVKLPEAVTEVSSISISAPEEIFYTTNGTEEKTRTLSLDFENCEIGNDHILTAYMMTSWQDVTIESGTKLTIDVTVPGRLCHYTKTMSKKEDIALNGGACLNIDISNATTLDHVLSGTGTEADPYLLYDAEDMMAVGDFLSKGTDTEAKYFKMVNDIDMKMASFTALTPNPDCAYKIDFTSDITNGSRKTLRNLKIENQTYASIFGILNGNVHDVDFENIQVKQINNDTAIGVICGFLGSMGGYEGIIKNVDIKKSSVEYDNQAVNSCGVVCGYFGQGEIDNVNVDNDCYASLKFTNSPGIAAIGLGGIAGRMRVTEEFTIKNCTCNATLEWLTNKLTTDHGSEGMGGIIGVVSGQKTKFTINNCKFAGQMKIDSGINLYHIGGIVGLDATGGLKIIDCTNNANITLNQHYVGGIIGRSKANEQTVTNCEISGCKNYGKINSSAKNFIAGIAGELSNDGKITACHNYNEITGTQRVVGIVAKTGANAVISECTNNGKITANGQYSGGIVGEFLGSEIEKCDNYADVNAAGYVGGIAGYLKDGTISNCKVLTKDGSKITNNSGNNVGGIVGWSEKGSVSNCSVNIDITATSSTYVGGIIGNFYEGTASDCDYTGQISAASYAGGISGSGGYTKTPKTIKITKCFSNASISTSGGNAGGICGIIEPGESGKPSEISECWYNGNMTVGDNSGGIVGQQGKSGGISDVIIENCYTAGTITNKAGQRCGGIAGECYKNSKIRNCYSTMSISGGGRVFGSIAGRFNNGAWKNANLDYNMELTNCIAAGSIDSKATTTNLGSSGAVAGNATTDIAHYTNCWRIFGFNFQCAYSAGAGLVDQGYTVTSYTVGTYAGGAGGSVNWNPYHGSAATASALQAAYSGWTTSKTDAQITVSDIAAAINTADATAFASDIWDLSGEHPTLKNNPEPAAE